MKWLAATIPPLAFFAFLVVRAETPWFSPTTADIFSVAASDVPFGYSQTVVVGTVPNGKRLVLTDAALGEAPQGLIEVDEVDASGNTVVKMPTLVFSASTGDEGMRPVSRASGLGTVFGPGTSVVLRNTQNHSGCVCSYILVGYFVPK